MSRPNVIVFFTDQQRWDTTGVHDNPMDLTPNFDRMAQEGTHFYNTFTCQPVCGPARSVLQTGKYATSTGVWRNGIGLRPKERTLAHHFKEAGYTTGYVGKWHLHGGTEAGPARYAAASNDPVPRECQGGYDYWRGSNVLEFVSNAYDFRLFDEQGLEHRYPGYRVDAQTDLAIRYIDENKDRPFFLFLSYLEPHHQNHADAFLAPKGYEERYRDGWLPPDLQELSGTTARQLPGYYGCIKRLDEALGRIDDTLTSLDLQENTIVLYISDHGTHFRTRVGFDKRSGHDSSIRVPCMAKGPGFDQGGRVKDLFSLVDIPPTLLDAAGVPIPDEMEGQSFFPIVQKRGVAEHDDVFIQISESGVSRAVRTRKWKYIVLAEGTEGFFDPSGPIFDAPDSDIYTESELYDLEYDPYELRNLIGLSAYRPVADRMRERLLQRVAETEGKNPEIKPAATIPSGQSMLLAEEVEM